MSGSKIKIYLSKSKAGNMDNIIKTRNFLEKYDIEILEFAGGDYSSNLLDSSDVVLILPAVLPKAFNYTFFVGKGQYYEMQRSFDKCIPLYFVICLGDELYVSEYDDCTVIDRNWNKEYAQIWCEETMKPLHIYLPQLNKAPSKSSKKSFLALYDLFIKKVQ